MVERTADRLVLVDRGDATEFKGSLDDYTAFVLSQGKAERAGAGDKPAKINRKDERRLAAEARERSQSPRKNVQEAERETARLARRRSEIDRALSDPARAEKIGREAGRERGCRTCRSRGSPET